MCCFYVSIVTGTISPYEFIDSAEWLMRHTSMGSRFEYDVIAEEDCWIVKFPRETLADVLSENPDVRGALQGILALDVSAKLLGS